MYNVNDYSKQLRDIFEKSIPIISNIKPSDWTEQNVVMQKPYPGPFKYSKTPYTREIIDCLAPDHPARWVAIMKGAQVGFSSGVIMPGCAWLIKNNPCNTFITVGAPDLIEKATEKLDLIIDSAGLRNYIKPQVNRKRNNKTGDTNFKKEFPLGYIAIASANNHKAIRQVDLQIGFFDDFEAIKSASKESGSTRKLLEQRFAAYADTHKIYYISTPELKHNSNIEPAYLLGDQRKFLIPCSCCGEFIELKWSIPVEGTDGKETGGITWKLDSGNKVISDSVGYICQKCGGFFNDKNKHEMLNNGFWKPTTDPSKPGYYSYHLNSLYAPIGMYDWEHYVNDYIEANPPNKPQDKALYKTFVNVVLGETYEETGEAPKANDIQKNIRNYEIGIIPEELSKRDGNGSIVLLTCACDLNGVIDDARLDYEIVAWSETGASYSVIHGSIGTFIPRENSKKHKEDRERWTYEHYQSKSVWKELDKIIDNIYVTDSGKKMKVFMTGIDTGHYTLQAYAYIDNSNFNVIGLKGDKEGKYIKYGIDVPNFKPARERAKLYILQVGLLKDDLADMIKLKWDIGNDDEQPPGFMNFPLPSEGKYLLNNYFSHYESEHRVPDPEGNFRWVKKTSVSQNHFFDVRIYNMALKEIVTSIICKEVKMKSFTWNDYVNLVLGKKQA